MKKIIFLLACITFSVACLGQEIALSNTVNIKAPKGMSKLTAEHISGFTKEKFGDKKALMTMVDNNPKHAYRIDNILISFHSETGAFEESHLQKLKNGLDEMFVKNKTYSSSLETVNGNSVLKTLSSGEADIRYYNFFALNKEKTNIVSGSLQFNKSDENKAKAILDDFLNSLKFKR